MITYIEIQGFKSIGKLTLDLRPINILIGGNGAGKSNFISFFKLLSSIFNNRLQKYVIDEKVDNILHFGRKNTELMSGKLIFQNAIEHNNAYRFGLAPTSQGELFLEYEGSGYNVSKKNNTDNYYHSYDNRESRIAKDEYKRNVILREYISSLQIFHFHDTSSTSFLRRECDINDNLYFKSDGRNLPAFLYLLKIKHPKIFGRIEKTIQSIAPYIEKLLLEPSMLNDKEIEMRWVDKGDINSNFSAYQLSDGTLRFIALATLLLQPNPPAVIIIDEPEIGLHPFAINKLAGMIQAVSSKAQVIVATQSPYLISNFSPEDIIVVDKSDSENQSTFHRLDPLPLRTWLEEFSLGDLWERNIINAAQPFAK